jgi:hypothetical protein
MREYFSRQTKQMQWTLREHTSCSRHEPRSSITNWKGSSGNGTQDSVLKPLAPGFLTLSLFSEPRTTNSMRSHNYPGHLK